MVALASQHLSPNTRPKRKQAFLQAVDLQRTLFAIASDPLTKAGDVAKAALAWERLEERKRILRMKPLPKAVDVSKPKAKAPKSEAMHPDDGPIQVHPAHTPSPQ